MAKKITEETITNQDTAEMSVEPSTADGSENTETQSVPSTAPVNRQIVNIGGVDYENAAPIPFHDGLSEQQNIVQIDLARKKKIVGQLNTEKKMAIFIPMGIGDKPGATHEVGINGVVLVYPKGKMMLVPETIFYLLAEHFNITYSAGESMRIDRRPDIETALS